MGATPTKSTPSRARFVHQEAFHRLTKRAASRAKLGSFRPTVEALVRSARLVHIPTAILRPGVRHVPQAASHLPIKRAASLAILAWFRSTENLVTPVDVVLSPTKNEERTHVTTAQVQRRRCSRSANILVNLCAPHADLQSYAMSTSWLESRLITGRTGASTP